MVIRNKSKARRNDPMKTLASHKEKYYVAGRSYNVKQTKEMKHNFNLYVLYKGLSKKIN